ncbi:MAG: hypothetical protein LUQ38_06660 [Methanotrichaceae archaeon]|nr:hypothetical protein [Methanotrichaceae archaeon]
MKYRRLEMKIECLLILALVICCPVIAIEYKTYINEFFKVEYPANWLIQEPLRTIKGDDQGSASGSRLVGAAYRLPQDLNYVFYSIEVREPSDTNSPTQTSKVVMVTVHVIGSEISVELADSSKSFSIFNETGYIDDPLLRGLNKTEYVDNPLLHFLSTFQVSQPNVKEIPIGQLSDTDEQIERILKGQELV